MEVFGGNWVGYWEKIKADWSGRVRDDDIVLISGDISWALTLDGALDDLAEIDSLNGKKFLIEGNHDYWWSSYKKVRETNFQSLTFIQYNAFKVGDYIICGTRGWTVPEKNAEQSGRDAKIFKREINRLELSLKEAKRLQAASEEIIVMMHFPPFNARFEKSEFTDLIAAHGIKTVVYGHLHGGANRYKEIVNMGQTNYYLTSCDFLNNKLFQLNQ